MFSRFRNNNNEKGARPVYVRWQFWVIVVALAVLGGGYSWWANERAAVAGSERNLDNVITRAYWEYLERKSDNLEAAYRADDVGGETPEETLRLFVEALEAEDFELAAKYFIPENQEEALRENRAGEGGSNQFFVDAYRDGNVVSPSGSNTGGIYEIEVFPPDESIAFAVRLKENEFTNVWKILEL